MLKNFKKFTKSFNHQGFSLVETLVAVSIIILAIVGPITTAQRSFVSAEYSKDQVRAYYLAEEGLEYIHYIRDLNALSNGSQSWLTGLNNCIVSGSSKNGCAVDPSVTGNQNITSCNDPENTPSVCKLNFNSNTGIYSHQNGSNFTTTNFRRWVKIYDTNNPIEKNVTVSVEWKTGSLPKRIINVSGFITDWKEQPFK